MKKILFVCTGNTCRSPMAEALLRHIGEDQFKVKSAGVFALEGSDASIYAKQALEEKGILSNHSASLLQETTIQWADYVLTMTNSHKQIAIQAYPTYREKIYTLSEFVRHDTKDIADPFGGMLVDYRETLQEIEELLIELKKIELS